MTDVSAARQSLIEKLRALKGRRGVQISDETDVLYDLKLKAEDLEELLVWMQDHRGVDLSNFEYTSGKWARI